MRAYLVVIAIACEWNFNALFDSRTNRCFERGGDVTIGISLEQFSVQLSDVRDCIAMAFTAICGRVHFRASVGRQQSLRREKWKGIGDNCEQRQTAEWPLLLFFACDVSLPSSSLSLLGSGGGAPSLFWVSE